MKWKCHSIGILISIFQASRFRPHRPFIHSFIHDFFLSYYEIDEREGQTEKKIFNSLKCGNRKSQQFPSVGYEKKKESQNFMIAFRNLLYFDIFDISHRIILIKFVTQGNKH